MFKRNANELKNKMWWKNIKVSSALPKNCQCGVVSFFLGVVCADEAHNRLYHPGDPGHHHRRHRGHVPEKEVGGALEGRQSGSGVVWKLLFELDVVLLRHICFVRRFHQINQILNSFQ